MVEKEEVKKYVLTEADGFVPQVIDEKWGYGIMVVRLDKCKYCGEWMLTDSILPGIFDINAKKKQIARAGWKTRGYVGMQTLDVHICTECVEKDAKTFLCAFCGKQKKSSEIEKYIGYPAEYLCKDCYSKVSAKVWDEKVEDLEEEHEWDCE